MAAWEGFPTMVYGRDGFPKMESGAGELEVHADRGQLSDEQIPLVGISQNLGDGIVDVVELTEAQFRWLVDEVAPEVLKSFGGRP